MQLHSRLVFCIDLLVGTAVVFLLNFALFMRITEFFLLSLCLSFVLTLLLLYAFFLLRRRRKIKQNAKARAKQLRKNAVYALTMLPFPTALRHSSDALCRKYALKPSALPFYDRNASIVTDLHGNTICISLEPCPEPASVRTVHAFHKMRSAMMGVLICAGGASASALEYAAALYPPLRLIDAEELPFSQELSCRFTAPCSEAAAKKRTASLLLHAGKAQAVRCMLYSVLFLVLYLITNRLSILSAALFLIFISLWNKRSAAAPEELFTA